MSILSFLATKIRRGNALYARHIPGGIKLFPHKKESLRSRIMSTPIPEQLHIPTESDNSSALSSLVKVGDRVLKYQNLGFYTPKTSQDNNQTHNIPIHAPTSGTVTAIELVAVASAHSEQLCIQLKTDGLDEEVPLQEEPDYQGLEPSQLVKKITNAGVMGVRNADFPVANKLPSASNRNINLLIINATECEPYISADEALIRERADSVILGADILRIASQAERCVIAIEDSKKEAIAALIHASTTPALEKVKVEIQIIPSKYPAGGEKQIIQCLTGKEVPSGKHPASIGILTQNTDTAYATFKAIIEGKSCISRITTLTGKALKTPKNFETLIGTSATFLFELCGVNRSTKTNSIAGGSLTGRQLTNENAVIDKTSNCLIAGTLEEFPVKPPPQACIRCGFCADVCPAKLLPQQLLAFAQSENNNELSKHGLFDCIECGACDYVCPSHIPLVNHYQESKSRIHARELSLEKSQQWQQRFQFHQYRIKRDKELALARKANPPKQKTHTERQESSAQSHMEQEFFSKEKASREIAAAVARVKARRNQATTKNELKKEPMPGDSE
jgi:electron transport complex protein RnfC